MRNFTSRKGMVGASVTAWIMTIIVIVFFGVFGTKTVPAYLDNNTVTGIVESVLADKKIGLDSPKEIQSHIARRFIINNIEDQMLDNIAIEKVGSEIVVVIDYEVRNNFIKNIDLVIAFKQEFRRSII